MRMIVGLMLVALAVTFCEARSAKARSRRQDMELEIDHVTKKEATKRAVEQVRDLQKMMLAKRKRAPSEDTPRELFQRAKVISDALARDAAKRGNEELDLAAKIRRHSRAAAKRHRLQRGLELKAKREQQNKERRAQHELNIKRGLANMKTRMAEVQETRKRALDTARAVKDAVKKNI